MFNFVKFVVTKKGMTTNFFCHPSLLLLFLHPGSRCVKIRIRDKHPGSATLVVTLGAEEMLATAGPHQQQKSQ